MKDCVKGNQLIQSPFFGGLGQILRKRISVSSHPLCGLFEYLKDKLDYLVRTSQLLSLL